VATLDVNGRLLSWLARYGRPIRYGYVERPWPIDMYQNVYATEPGSAEMPSAGRPFTPEIITRLVAKGVGVTPLVLHTGVASLEADELPYPERVQVPRVTADRVNAAHRVGRRVVAVGTTVVRALETAVGDDGAAHAYDGWTDLVISKERGVRAVDGMITGWHEPESSHLMMLEAIAGPDLLRDSYEVALSSGYLWHEFGDVHLILP
jgi:S-adenosylmethionine:tRNA ribosyltransferase-isomerase